MTEHVLEAHDEPDGCPYHPRSCHICDGGLSNCLVCRGAEASLPTDCPGEAMSDERQVLVQNQTIDFRDGAWVTLPGTLPFALPRLLEETS